MRLAEVHADGAICPVDVVANYAHDVHTWGRRTATHNALYVLRVLSGLEAPPAATLEDARREAREQDPARWRSVLVALAEEEEAPGGPNPTGY